MDLNRSWTVYLHLSYTLKTKLLSISRWNDGYHFLTMRNICLATNRPTHVVTFSRKQCRPTCTLREMNRPHCTWGILYRYLSICLPAWCLLPSMPLSLSVWLFDCSTPRLRVSAHCSVFHLPFSVLHVSHHELHLYSCLTENVDRT